MYGSTENTFTYIACIIMMTEVPCSGQHPKEVYPLTPSAIRSERSRTPCDKGRTRLADTVRKREAKLGLEELFDVRPPDILRLFNFHDAKNLQENMVNA